MFIFVNAEEISESKAESILPYGEERFGVGKVFLKRMQEFPEFTFHILASHLISGVRVLVIYLEWLTAAALNGPTWILLFLLAQWSKIWQFV